MFCIVSTLILMPDVKENVCHLLSMRTSSELLSNWFTCTTSGQGFSVRTHTHTHKHRHHSVTINNNNNNNNSVKCKMRKGFQITGFMMDVIMQFQPTQARVGEPGCVGVEVDVFYNDRQAGA